MQVLTASELFYGFFGQKYSKNIITNLRRPFPRLFIQLHKQQKRTGFCDDHWIAWNSGRELFRVREVVGRWSGQGTL